MIAEIEVQPAEPAGLTGFTIRESQRREKPTVRISPDLPVCDDCLQEMFDPGKPRYHYPYINCTNCGPRYTVILALPYDRPNTTMKRWPLDAYCDARVSRSREPAFSRAARGLSAVRATLCAAPRRRDRRAATTRRSATVELAANGKIVAVKGLGGYHLACDARNAAP